MNHVKLADKFKIFFQAHVNVPKIKRNGIDEFIYTTPSQLCPTRSDYRYDSYYKQMIIWWQSQYSRSVLIFIQEVKVFRHSVIHSTLNKKVQNLLFFLICGRRYKQRIRYYYALFKFLHLAQTIHSEARESLTYTLQIKNGYGRTIMKGEWRCIDLCT